jgi:hypothetical protein
MCGSVRSHHCFDAIHDQAHPAQVLREIADAAADRCISHGGHASIQQLHENLDLPLAALLYSVSCSTAMTVSLALDGTGLGTMLGEQKPGGC